jgi:hypothetical protein
MSPKRTRTQPNHAMEPTANRPAERLKDEVQAKLAAGAPEWLICVSFGTLKRGG